MPRIPAFRHARLAQPWLQLLHVTTPMHADCCGSADSPCYVDVSHPILVPIISPDVCDRSDCNVNGSLT